MASGQSWSYSKNNWNYTTRPREEDHDDDEYDDDEYDDDYDEQPTAPHPDPTPALQHDQLASRPSEASDIQRISLAVDQLHHRYSGYTDPPLTGQPSSSAPLPGNALPPNSGYSNPSSFSRGTERSAIDYTLPATLPVVQVHNDSGRPPVSQRPLSYLPTIDSGEPLKWDDTNIGREDPFTDSAYRQSIASYGSGVPPRPVSQLSAAHEYSRGPSPVLSTGAGSSTYTTNFLTNAGPADTPTRLVQRRETTPLKTGSPKYMDHFRHDTEAYASGTYSRYTSTPRSRSPTPAVGDDYHAVGNDSSIHYTGTSRPLQEDDEEEDDDEGEDEEDYDEKVDYDDDDASSAQSIYLNQPGVPFQLGEQTPVPETPVETRHFGPAPPGRILRRHKTKKRVPLTNGNLVLELPVPPKLVLPRKGDNEVMKTRYTAVTCDPDEFEQRFFLRQNQLGRRTELFICITMFNEDEILFCRTMYGVMRNISHLCSRKNSHTWGVDAWKKVVVCIVADGRKRVHPRVLDCLTLLGVYQPGGHMQNAINNKPVTAHLFEYTTSFALDPNLHFRYPDKGIMPTQIIFCMKEKNQKKINSHRWFFNAFGRLLQPNICVLLDVGTRPGNKSIYHLWKTFDLNSNVGGACGEIAAYKGKNWTGLLNPLVAAQNFEYKVSNILDKPTESLFGYISVLPGAFSAYRYIALQNDKSGRGPLASYFKGEILHGRDTDIFTSNMYLAEDRILCFELVAKANSSWVLRYVKSAVGETDVPEALPEFIGQRRRWLNGSFFAATYAIAHIGQLMSSGHSISRKVALLFQTIYNIINLVASWFAIGNFYLFFVILTSSLESPSFHMHGIRYFNSVAQYFMASIVVACFLFSMGNKPRSSKWRYKLIALFLAIFMVYLIFAAVKCSIIAAQQGGTAYQIMWFSIIVTYGVYTFASFLAFDPWHMFTSFIPYLLLSPTYINILNIYAFSNLDDISWGTKEDTTVDNDLGVVVQDVHMRVDVEMLAEAADANDLYEEAIQNLKHRTPVYRGNGTVSEAEKEQAARDYYAGVRTNVLLAWVMSNALLLVGILGGGQSTTTFAPGGGITAAKAYMTFVLAFVGLTSIIRFLGSTFYLVARVFTG